MDVVHRHASARQDIAVCGANLPTCRRRQPGGRGAPHDATAAAADAVREQQDILADVEARLGRAVSSAVAQRDAEQVLADATDRPGDGPAQAPDPHEVGPRTPVLAGVASLLAVVALSTAAVPGLTGNSTPGEDPAPDPSATETEVDSQTATPTLEGDVSGPDPTDLVEDEVPDVGDDVQGDGPDGFVPAPPAQ